MVTGKGSIPMKAFIKGLMIIVCMAVMPRVVRADNKNQWTWLHRRQLSECEQQRNKHEKEISFSKKDIPAFTQLVFSWNAFRPTKGHFVFYGQVRNASTKKWSKWHRMMMWGVHVQKSFITESDKVSHYLHVRLELNAGHYADGFTIKIEALDGADLSLLKSFSVNVANLNDFNPEDETIMDIKRSVYIKKVPCFSQFELNHPRNDGLCSPTSCAMLTGFLLSRSIDPVDFAEKSFDSGLDKYGSWPFNMAHAFEKSEGKVSFAVARLNSVTNLHDHLCKGIPVVVSVRGYLPGAPRVYQNGHLLIVVGYDSKTKEVICHDPAVADAQLCKKRYPLKSFMNAWERSHRLAYLADRIQMKDLP